MGYKYLNKEDAFETDKLNIGNMGTLLLTYILKHLTDDYMFDIHSYMV